MWVGIGLLVLKFALVAMILHHGGSDDLRIPGTKSKGIQSELRSGISCSEGRPVPPLPLGGNRSRPIPRTRTTGVEGVGGNKPQMRLSPQIPEAPREVLPRITPEI